MNCFIIYNDKILSKRKKRLLFGSIQTKYEAFRFTCSQNILGYLAFQPFDFERTWLRLFQKRVVRTEFDIYVYSCGIWRSTI
jgi:hypothetical protein